jgi:hypothetical protein
LRLSHAACSSSSSLLQLTRLGSVSKLELERIGIKGEATAAGEALGEAVQQLLLSMQQLASLSMSCMHLAEGSISQLPSSLMYLDWFGVNPPHVDTGSVSEESCLARSITHLPQLQVLCLNGSSVYPTVLASMPQLQRLSLAELYLLPQAADAGGQAGEVALLSVVGTLHHLSHLRLYNTLEEDADLQQYSGLAACSQLTSLEIAAPEAYHCLVVQCSTHFGLANPYCSCNRLYCKVALLKMVEDSAPQSCAALCAHAPACATLTLLAWLGQAPARCCWSCQHPAAA